MYLESGLNVFGPSICVIFQTTALAGQTHIDLMVADAVALREIARGAMDKSRAWNFPAEDLYIVVR